MMARLKLLIGLLLLLTGCRQAVSQPPLSPPSPSPTSPTPNPSTPSPSPPEPTKRFKLRLTLSSPEDLRVREGDRVAEGQVLAERVKDRTRLETQKKQIQIQIDKLKAPLSPVLAARPIPALAGLPRPTFLNEVAEIERQKILVTKAQRRQQLQQRKLDVLQTLPAHELPAATMPHEQEQLAERDREVAQAEAELQVAEGKLAQAKQEREYQEYQFSVAASNRALQMQQQELQREAQIQKREEQERNRDFQLAQITAQMQAIETQLAALSAVRSPYHAKIHRVKFEGQENQNLGVELTLVVSGKLSVPSVVPAGAAVSPAQSVGEGNVTPSAGAE